MSQLKITIKYDNKNYDFSQLSGFIVIYNTYLKKKLNISRTTKN